MKSSITGSIRNGIDRSCGLVRKIKRGKLKYIDNKSSIFVIFLGPSFLSIGIIIPQN
jgi:hypothetical protein